MSTPLKIRFLLFLLTVCLAGTALTVDLTLHTDDILRDDARKLERRLNEKEDFIKAFLNDSLSFQKLKTIDKDPELASRMIVDFRDNHSIYLFTYRNNNLVFWSSNRIAISTDYTLREGNMLVNWQNGWYESIKKTEGDFSVICLIPIKANYPVENKYLRNSFEKDLISADNLDIAGFNDKAVYNVNDANGKYLFSVKLKPEVKNTFYVEVGLWVFAILFGCFFINYVCLWIASKGYIKTAIGLLTLLITLLRIVDLETNWFYTHFGLEGFRPDAGTGSYFFPSPGAFFLNVASALWLLIFIYSYRYAIKIPQKLQIRPLNYLTFILAGILLCIAAFQVETLFFNLISNAAINIDLTNILNLDWFSWTGVLMLCICVLNLYLLLEILLIIGLKLELTNRQRLMVFIAGIVLVLIIKLALRDYGFYFLVFALIVFLRAWAVYKNNNEFNLSSFVTVALAFAVMASVKLSDFQFQREQEQRKTIAKRLESADDPNAALLLPDLEEKILKDPFVINFFAVNSKDYSLLNDHFQRFYFNGYLSRYSFETLEYDQDNNSAADTSLESYKSRVLSGSTKISGYFYRNNNTFGSENYFGLLPIEQNGLFVGTLAVELKSKKLQDIHSFPPVLTDEKATVDNELQSYSFAYYNDGHLVNQHGDYVYDLVNNDFKGQVGNFIFKEKNGYDHLVYHLKEKRLIVVSKPSVNWVMHLASVSFLFLVLLLFTGIVVLLYWTWITLSDRNVKIHHFRWKHIFSRQHVLYKTRIQASMIMAIVVTLIVVGVITYISISFQYRKQQEGLALKRINQIDEGIESEMAQSGVFAYNENLLNAFTNLNATELNLYATNGILLYTTQPKIYHNSMQSDRMNPLAFIYLNKYQRSEYIHNEHIGKMTFISAYMPIRNARNETVAYLNIPDFSNESDLEEQIGQFLNTLINIYALVFVAIGFFAVFVANKITYPLTLVQKRLSETKIGRKNEPIVWEREDEIGKLIREYNRMIEALEESAQKFARTERETAWKEMAKQVAHEIKNPLTPLKLGVQLLDKSWREKDPNFDKKFEKFSKSFIEQIESLSHIASEFSNFAKMPETLLEDVNLREIIEQSIEVFQPIHRITITLQDNTKSSKMVKGDRDQLLRSFNNLIKNAVEAIPDERPGMIEIVMQDIDHHILVEITDNGKGIPEGLRERIFNPNFTTKSSGTGLGLAFVKQAVENMAGTIRFVTDAEKGTTFYITVPLSKNNLS